MEQMALFQILSQIASGQGTLSEVNKQSRRLMDMVRGVAEPETQVACLQAFLDVVLRETFNVVSARQYLNEFVAHMSQCEADVAQPLIGYALEKMTARAIFEEEMYPLRLRLADELERQQEWVGAARVLAAIPLESGHKHYSKETKMELYVRMSRLFLEAEEFTEAENYISRLGLFIDSQTGEEMRVQHSAAVARIQDLKRQYIEASQRYYDLSRRPSVAASERTQALTNAVNCILLAPVSPQRARGMAVLVQDTRVLELPAYAFLRKVWNGQTIERAEMKDWAARLPSYQRDALTPDGAPLLEHHILSTRTAYGEQMGKHEDADKERIRQHRELEDRTLLQKRHYDDAERKLARSEEDAQRRVGRAREDLVKKRTRDQEDREIAERRVREDRE